MDILSRIGNSLNPVPKIEAIVSNPKSLIPGNQNSIIKPTMFPPMTISLPGVPRIPLPFPIPLPIPQPPQPPVQPVPLPKPAPPTTTPKPIAVEPKPTVPKKAPTTSKTTIKPMELILFVGIVGAACFLILKR